MTARGGAARRSGHAVGTVEVTDAEGVEGAHYITERIRIVESEMEEFGVTEPWVDVLVLVDASGKRLTPELRDTEPKPGQWVTHALTATYFDGLSIPPLASGRFKPPRVHGDREFNGTTNQQPIWEVTAQVKRSANKLYGYVTMHAWEDDGDASEGEGGSGWIEIGSVPSNKIIKSIAGSDRVYRTTNLTASRNDRDSNGYQVQTIADTGVFVLNWKVWGDTNGDDLDFFTGVRADLQRIYVQYE